MIHFICPDPEAFVSGGNLYNRRLLRVLRESGYQIRRWELKDFLQSKPRGGKLYLFDSIFLDQLRNMEDRKKLPSRRAVLCHYLPGLEKMRQDGGAAFKERWCWLKSVFETAIVPSSFLREVLIRQLDWEPSRVWRIWPVLSIPADIHRKISSPPLLLIVANFLPVKGILPFLQQLEHALVAEPAPFFRLLVFGDQSLDKSYTQEVRHLVDDSRPLSQRVSLRKPVPAEDLFRYYRAASLLLSTSGFETFGMANAEALLSGLPVLGRRGGNTEYLLNKFDHGLITSSLEEMMEVLLQLLHRPQAFESLHRMAKQIPAGHPFNGKQAVRRVGEILKSVR